MMMQWLAHFNELPQHDIMPGMRGRFLHSERMTFAFWEIDDGFILPEHSHPQEQVAHLIEGRFEMTVKGETKLLHPGAVSVIPGNALHSGKALSACKILDIFTPRRLDYEL